MSEEVSTLSHSHLTFHLRMAATAAAALAACSSMDMLYQESVRFIRSQSGVERCAVVGFDGAGQRALYGDETHPFDLSDYAQLLDENFWNEHLPQLQHLEQQIIEYDGRWIALTPIRQSVALLAILVNDSPVSHSPIHAETQELIAACCALLGTLIAHKSAEFGWAQERNLLRRLLDNPTDLRGRNASTPVTASEAASSESAQAAGTRLQSEAWYRSLVELSPDGIAIYQAGAFVYANKSLYRLLGALESDRLSVERMREAIHPAYLDTIRGELMQALE